MEFTHLDEQGKAVMVDVSEKDITMRMALARGRIRVSAAVMEAVADTGSGKGDVLAAARIAGIMAAKRTSELIPLCHSLPLDSVKISFDCDAVSGCIIAECAAKNHGRTGVEMEALTGVSVALLTIYDMCKAVDRKMEIGEIRLIEKHGGKSGDFYA